MKIATYNVNSIKARGANLCKWLQTSQPDIVFLQEIKCETENFLYFECESLGYKATALGQKSYNGVAILSKYDFDITSRNPPDLGILRSLFMQHPYMLQTDVPRTKRPNKQNWLISSIGLTCSTGGRFI